MKLTEQQCQPCAGGIPPLQKEDVAKLLSEIPGWILSADGKNIEKIIKLKNFKMALAWINKVGELAEQEKHHPDIIVSYNKVTLRLWTHAIGGLSHNDFILAAKINQITL